jgi:hypothetical protein
MLDIPPLVDDAIAFAKCEGLDAAWAGWRELAYEIGGQQSGLSQEESGRALLADTRNVPTQQSRPLNMNNQAAPSDPRGEFKHSLEKRIIEAVDSKKWILKAPSGEPISPDLITTWSRLHISSSFDFGAGCIVLIGGTRVPRVRLVRAEPVAPATTPQAVAPAPAPDVTAQAVAPQEYRSPADPTIHQKLMPVFEAARAEGDKISAREAAKRVRPQLNVDGYDASIRHIEQLGLQPQYKSVRRPPGATRPSKRRRRRAS